MMMLWEAETTVIRLIAVVLVFALLHGRGGRSGRWIVFSMLAVTACGVAYFMRGGAGDLVSALAGAAVAAALTVPLALSGRISRRTSAAAVAAGSVLGPAGAVATLGVTAALHMIARLAGTGAGLFPDRFEPLPMEAEERGDGSLLTTIERGRFARRIAGTGSTSAVPAPAQISKTIPLRITLAVAMLAALMTEAFI
jgi:hypothetical protein